jgi:importin-8
LNEGNIFLTHLFHLFPEMMPALHNYITVDTPAFLANPEHVQIIYNMCKTVSKPLTWGNPVLPQL